MAKESEKVTRIDVRIPNDIYEQIEKIAVETNQPVHHRSGKPVVTPIILNLINLGLEAVSKEEFDLEVLTDKVSANNRIDLKQIEERVIETVSDKLSGNNQIDIEEIEKKLLASLGNKLESMVFAKVNEVLDKISSSNTESEVDEEIKSESINYFPDEDEEEIEDTAVKEEEIKTESELIIDSNDKLLLNQSELAKRLGYKNHSGLSKQFKKLSKEQFIEWSKSKDPDGNGWYKVGDKFEVVKLRS